MRSQGLFLFFFCMASMAGAETSGRALIEGLNTLSAPVEPISNREFRFEGELSFRHAWSDRWNARLQPVVRATSASGAEESTAFIDPREAFLEFRGKNSGFAQIGFFTPTWEGTDGVNPMDIAAVRDNGDPLRLRTLGSAGLRWGGAAGSWEYEALFVPSQTRTRLPGPRSGWWPRRTRLPLRTDRQEFRLPDRVDYEPLNRETINGALSNNGGGRVIWRGESLETTLAFFEGAAETPILRPSTLNLTVIEFSTEKEVYLLQSPVSLTATDYRRRTGAFGFTWTLGEWIVRAASRYDQPMGTDAKLPGWSQQTVAGFERTVDIAGDSVTFLLQGSWTRRQQDESIVSVGDLFEKAVLGGFRWPVGESWTVFVSGFRSSVDGSWFAQAEVGRRWTDTLSTEFFAQMLDGPPQTLPGILGDRDRLGLRLITSF